MTSKGYGELSLRNLLLVESRKQTKNNEKINCVKKYMRVTPMKFQAGGLHIFFTLFDRDSREISVGLCVELLVWLMPALSPLSSPSSLWCLCCCLDFYLTLAFALG